MEKGSKFTAFLAIIVCIVSLGGSIYFHSLFQKERKLSNRARSVLGEVQAQLKLIREKNARLARDLSEAKSLETRLVKEKKEAAEYLQEARQRIVRLEGNLAKTPKEVDAPAGSTKRLAKVNPGEQDIESELTKLREEKLKLEVELQKRTGSIPGSVDLGKVKVHTGKRFSGNVLVVNRRYEFVVIDLGKDHGMETEIVLILHRGRKFLGKVMVEKVYERMSAATMMLDWMQDEPKVGDGVKKF